MKALSFTVHCSVDRFAIASRAKALAQRAGLDAKAASEVALCVSELSSNLLRHAQGGELTVRVINQPQPAIEVVAKDTGPGMTNVALAMQDGWSRGDYLNADSPRQGLGSGLGAAKRAMSELAVCSSPSAGTTITARKWLHK